MEKLLEYCLSLLFIAAVFASCEKDTSQMSEAEKKQYSVELYKEAVGLHAAQGDPRVMTKLEHAVAMDPNNCKALRELSVAYLKRGLIDEWKIKFDKAANCDPKIWVPWRGYLYLQFYRDYEKAIADFDASDTLTPDFTDAPQGHSVDYWRGLAYLGLKDYENSIKYLNRYVDDVTKKNGEDWAEPTAFLYRGIAHYENNTPEAALIDLDKMIFYNQNKTADGSYYKALILFEQNKCEDAKKELETAFNNFKNGYFNKHHYTEALKQIYIQDLNNLENAISNQCPHKKEAY
ncbi:tetratricopeptide repeat protein [Aequorivita sediminis]|uniref:tetratricopeptide repeat protein n=1 Tax=Aequorivita sediminis TaxID=3073653 RepID=UPI0028AD0B0A|nr:tetratricopeptide repeat protein [Aequorivita sp. F6058]